MALILFDIDGILTRHVKTGAMASVMKEYYQLEQKVGAVYGDGKTHWAILAENLEALGIKEPEKDPRFLKALHGIAGSYLDVIAATKMESPAGVREFIAALKKENYMVGLLTGNTKEAAKMKLSSVNLWNEFSIGAFAK